jgi:hypothetical protein
MIDAANVQTGFAGGRIDGINTTLPHHSKVLECDCA